MCAVRPNGFQDWRFLLAFYYLTQASCARFFFFFQISFVFVMMIDQTSCAEYTRTYAPEEKVGRQQQGMDRPGIRQVFFPLSLCLPRWFWPDLMNRRHDHTTAVCLRAAVFRSAVIRTSAVLPSTLSPGIILSG